MSIAEMISSHPDVDGHLNEPLATAVRHAMFCAAICNSCADACSAEDGDMRQCIRSCSDCSDMCEATYRIATRRTGDNERLLRQILELCAAYCDACAEQCDKHDNDHCKRCAEMCRECAADCKTAISKL